jgi:hypothetical protein
MARWWGWVGLFVALAACGDSGGGAGTGGEGGGGEGGSSATYGQPGSGPGIPAGGPLPTSDAICCRQACACDATCTADSENHVARCRDRFAEDGSMAELAGCSNEFDAYFRCFALEWSCSEPDACEPVVEAFDACLSVLCDRANELCGCYGCEGLCRTPEERCQAACAVEAGSCGSEDGYYQCLEACWNDGVETTSSGSG